MPKNSVTDLITDQEIAFAHLILSGTMNDREAAEAACLNPTTASYTKSKPRVREYMEEHRAAVKEKLINQEADEMRKRNLAHEQIRERILDRLWELAALGPDSTKGSITGQVKAVGMIAAIEGLLPDRRRSPGPEQFAAPAVKPQSYVSEWMRKTKDEATGQGESVTAVEADPTTPPDPEPQPLPANDAPSANEDRDPTTQDDPFKGVSWAPNAIGPNLDAYDQTTSPLRQPFAPWKRRFGRGR
jgi:hypothetical protein